MGIVWPHKQFKGFRCKVPLTHLPPPNGFLFEVIWNRMKSDYFTLRAMLYALCLGRGYEI